jgi:hypothetical protein
MDTPDLIFYAADLTVGEGDDPLAQAQLLLKVLARLRASRSSVWRHVRGGSRVIEFHRSPSGAWWVHMHAHIAVRASEQPATPGLLASAWAARVRIVRWPDIPFDKRNAWDDPIFKTLRRNQLVRPLRAYEHELGMRKSPLPLVYLRDDIRRRAEYVRHRGVDRKRRSKRVKARLSLRDRVMLATLGLRLVDRWGIFRDHSAPAVDESARGIRAARISKSMPIRALHPSSIPSSSPYSAKARCSPPPSKTVEVRGAKRSHRRHHAR